MPETWVEKIFSHMEAMYGARFHDAWRGTDLAHVKGMWGAKLAGFHDQPERLKFALNALDAKPFPPTLPEFIELCRFAPRPELPALPEPRIDPAVAAERAAKMQEKALAAMRNPTGHQWAIRILEDIAAGVVLPRISEQFACEALRNLGMLDAAPSAYAAMTRPAWRSVQPKVAA